MHFVINLLSGKLCQQQYAHKLSHALSSSRASLATLLLKRISFFNELRKIEFFRKIELPNWPLGS
ncbi:hypothetical protein Zm00014a_039380 [Zea mays]|uniref:Uncharacterized protein n=1 Tax=Zea mays TaxID=4577 RepID=A0A3L6EP35_MAIZE|nr:hypothetical protein Zm00014a_039380 [Zea mays]